jgi:hypothetical protein
MEQPKQETSRGATRGGASDGTSGMNDKRGFAHDPQRAAEAGRKGGESTRDRPHKDAESGGERGRGGNFADDPQRASEAGRKGGKSSSRSR